KGANADSSPIPSVAMRSAHPCSHSDFSVLGGLDIGTRQEPNTCPLEAHSWSRIHPWSSPTSGTPSRSSEDRRRVYLRDRRARATSDVAHAKLRRNVGTGSATSWASPTVIKPVEGLTPGSPSRLTALPNTRSKPSCPHPASWPAARNAPLRLCPHTTG